MSALYIGVSGMLAHQARMDAIGNNIANANTVGYKGERVLFSDAFYELLESGSAPTSSLGGTDPSMLGQGVMVTGIDTSFVQGSLLATGRATDIAVEGPGFLAVTDGTEIFYTRHGAMGLDANGHLVHLASGLRVVAIPTQSGTPTAVTPASVLQVPLGQSSVAHPTSLINLGGNLDARSAPGTAYEVTARLYDSLGAGHDVTLTFTRSTTDGQWDVTGGSADGTLTVLAPAQVVFDPDGQPTGGPLSLEMTLSAPNGANATMAMNLDVNALSQLAHDSSAALLSQDGLAPGTLSGLSIESDGSVRGLHSNGLLVSFGQLVTGVFANPNGLRNIGNSLYQISSNSGDPTYGVPGSSGRGPLRSGQLEASNVDLAQEFADMIVTQRGFQASSRVVTAADEMLQELINVAR
jgi:flagellar hook protein FlgE